MVFQPIGFTARCQMCICGSGGGGEAEKRGVPLLGGIPFELGLKYQPYVKPGLKILRALIRDWD